MSDTVIFPCLSHTRQGLLLAHADLWKLISPPRNDTGLVIGTKLRRRQLENLFLKIRESFPDTSFPAPLQQMHAIRRKCRPKHQVLVLKCYPTTFKGAVDVKPNSSELSYLLYYATTRRSKVQKVGEFLETKTVSDVWRARIGNIQVTLQILAALIEKAPRDLPLYAPNVLKIFSTILRARDLTMAESSLPTFDSFCQHHDEASLYADQEYFRQYEEVVSLYVSFASKESSPTVFGTSTPISLKWRSLGLKAIKSVVSSEALATLANKQLNLIIPTLLDNTWSENPDFIDSLEQRVQAEERFDSRRLSRRRTSISTLHVEEASAEKKVALSGTTADADKIVEADIGVLAAQCLKLVFVVNNKSQIHSATLATLRFIADRVDHAEFGSSIRSQAKLIFKMASISAPVQDRYTILVTTMENLIQVPLVEENLQQQLVLATLINSLLKSDINHIGLSVMDVLLGLIQYILRVIQSSRPPSNDASSSVENQILQKSTDKTHESRSAPSPLRSKLLKKLQSCIGNLATHIYYSDQISDMITALLSRIRPSLSSESILGMGLENCTPPCIPITTSSDNNPLEESTNNFFSFDIAKLVALEAIRSVLIVAGYRKSMCGELARNCVPIQVWEGTEWLLRDSSGRVRKAYIAALITWAQHELTKADLRATEEKSTSLSRISREESYVALNKSVIPSTSQREKGGVNSPRPCSFLELLHLAIYENALKYFEIEEDIVLLHLLLSTFVEHLGVNAVKNGLPMIFRLQAELSEDRPPIAKIRIGCLCYGYFWTICNKFRIETSPIKEIIEDEIHRRQQMQFWIDKIRYPPISLEELKISDQSNTAQSQTPLPECSEPKSLKPFENRSEMVDLISAFYKISTTSLATSPTSPGRTSTQSNLGYPSVNGDSALPEKTKSLMMSDWSRENVIATARERAKTISLNGSKNGTAAISAPRFLSINGKERTASINDQTNLYLRHKNSSGPSLNNDSVGGLGNLQKLKKTSGKPVSSQSESSRNSVTRVEQLKGILHGQESRTFRNFALSNQTPSDNSSESLVSYDYTASEVSLNVSHQNMPLLERRYSNHDLGKGARSKSRDRKEKDAGTSISLSFPASNFEEAMRQDPPNSQDLTLSYTTQFTYSETQDQQDQINTMELLLKNIEACPDRAERIITKPPY